MYTQLYFHPVRRIYDKHLKEFLQEWLDGGRFSTSVEAHLRTTDSDVLTAIRTCDRDEGMPGHGSARRIARREHFRLVYEMNPADQEVNPNSVDAVEKELEAKFGADNVRRDTYIPDVEGIDFPIYTRDGRILSSLSMSKTLQRVPDFAVDCLYVHPQVRSEAESWLAQRRQEIISTAESTEGDSK
jgi:HD superfamily phosphohydrolase